MFLVYFAYFRRSTVHHSLNVCVNGEIALFMALQKVVIRLMFMSVHLIAQLK